MCVCVCAGLKPGQRKVIFTCFKRNDKREIKVAQLAGSVGEHSAYHHGEVSTSFMLYNYIYSWPRIQPSQLSSVARALGCRVPAWKLGNRTFESCPGCSSVCFSSSKQWFCTTCPCIHVHVCMHFLPCSLQQSLMSTIVNLAQNFVGSNNINLLQPRGQFGTRLHGGKDAASSRSVQLCIHHVYMHVYM